MAGDMILDNIEEFLFDEDRVVSYKWLSRTLSLHVNHAKRKLEEFADLWRDKEKSKPITLTFFISGTQETTSGNELNKVAIVKEGDLQNVKNSLKKTLCEHIYSIQKTTLKDTSALYQTDFDNTKQNLLECNKYSAISCEAAKARSIDTLAAYPVNQVPNGLSSHQDKPEIPKKVLSSNDRKKTQGLAAFLTKSKTESKPAATTEETKKDTTVKQKNSAPKLGSLMRAFQSSQKASKASPPKGKSQETSPSGKEEAVSKEKSDETTSKKPGETISEKAEETLSEKTEETSDKKDKTTLSASKEKKDDKPNHSPKATSPTTEKKGKTVDSKKATKRGISKADPESKEKGSKRRRVVRLEESSSSEDEESDVDLLEQQHEEEEEMDDTPIPPTPEARSKSTQNESQKSSHQGKDATRPKGRKKVWKKKRYLDDDGCMVTENVFMSESDGGSEDEDEPAPSAEKSSPAGDKKETSPSSDKGSKKSSPPSSGRKQTALTSFFKKK